MPDMQRLSASLPNFLDKLELVDVGLDGVRARVMRGEVLMVLFEFTKDVDVPQHSHGSQFGIVLGGKLTVTCPTRSFTLEAGDSYAIESGELHAAQIAKGTILLELFEDADRY